MVYLSGLLRVPSGPTSGDSEAGGEGNDDAPDWRRPASHHAAAAAYAAAATAAASALKASEIGYPRNLAHTALSAHMPPDPASAAGVAARIAGNSKGMRSLRSAAAEAARAVSAVIAGPVLTAAVRVGVDSVQAAWEDYSAALDHADKAEAEARSAETVAIADAAVARVASRMAELWAIVLWTEESYLACTHKPAEAAAVLCAGGIEIAVRTLSALVPFCRASSRAPFSHECRAHLPMTEARALLPRPVLQALAARERAMLAEDAETAARSAASAAEDELQAAIAHSAVARGKAEHLDAVAHAAANREAEVEFTYCQLGLSSDPALLEAAPAAYEEALAARNSADAARALANEAQAQARCCAD